MEKTKEERKEENCKLYEFLILYGMSEVAEIIKISAGNEDDAWDLIRESSPTNNGIEILLTSKLRNSLRELLKN